MTDLSLVFQLNQRADRLFKWDLRVRAVATDRDPAGRRSCRLGALLSHHATPVPARSMTSPYASSASPDRRVLPLDPAVRQGETPRLPGSGRRLPERLARP